MPSSSGSSERAGYRRATASGSGGWAVGAGSKWRTSLALTLPLLPAIVVTAAVYHERWIRVEPRRIDVL